MTKRHIIASIFFLLLVLFILGCDKKDSDSGLINNSKDIKQTNAEKYVPQCTADDSCVGDQTCLNGTCTDPKCSGCTYLDQATHACGKYDCCDDNACTPEKKCSYHKCVNIECDGCKYAENHGCVSYACCSDNDCDDKNDKTEDNCENAGKKTSKCTHNLTGDCGTSLSCFTGSLENCDKSEVMMGLQSEDDNYTWEYNLKVEVIDKNDDVCEVFMEIANVSVDFTDDYRSELEDEGKDDDEIDGMIDDKNNDADDYEGDDETCDIDENNLEDVTAVLESWQDDDKFTLDEFDCDSLTS